MSNEFVTGGKMGRDLQMGCGCAHISAATEPTEPQIICVAAGWRASPSNGPLNLACHIRSLPGMKAGTEKSRTPYPNFTDRIPYTKFADPVFYQEVPVFIPDFLP